MICDLIKYSSGSPLNLNNYFSEKEDRDVVLSLLEKEETQEAILVTEFSSFLTPSSPPAKKKKIVGRRLNSLSQGTLTKTKQQLLHVTSSPVCALHRSSKLAFSGMTQRLSNVFRNLGSPIFLIGHECYLVSVSRLVVLCP